SSVQAAVRTSGHDSTVMLTTSAFGVAATAVSATRPATTSKCSSAANRSRRPSTASAVVTSLANGAYNSALMIGALQACDYRCYGHTVTSLYPSNYIGAAGGHDRAITIRELPAKCGRPRRRQAPPPGCHTCLGRSHH